MFIRYELNQIPYNYTVEVRNRFKGLDLIDRVLDELWNEVRDTVQDRGIKTIPMEKKCKKIEENNRMGKTRDLFKKIRDTKGLFHAKMGSIKDRNGMHLTEEGIKKRSLVFPILLVSSLSLH